jgi:hypothetical protein
MGILAFGNAVVVVWDTVAINTKGESHSSINRGGGSSALKPVSAERMLTMILVGLNLPGLAPSRMPLAQMNSSSGVKSSAPSPISA